MDDFRQTLEKWGRLDIVVLNAGTWQGAPVHETSEQMWDLLLDLNLKGAFLTLKYAVPALIAGGGGTIVGIGSLGAWAGQPGASAYAASKWGLRGLLESVALELKPHRVRVSLVHPHNINSAGPPIARNAPERARKLEPSEIAALVAWICTAPDHVSVELNRFLAAGARHIVARLAALDPASQRDQMHQVAESLLPSRSPIEPELLGGSSAHLGRAHRRTDMPN